MPPPRLANRYFLVRSGESTFETAGVIRTNPVSKTSVDSGLSADGLRQTAKAALELKRLGACEDDCWIWPSITQRAYQAAEIIASVNEVNRRFISACSNYFSFFFFFFLSFFFLLRLANNQVIEVTISFQFYKLVQCYMEFHLSISQSVVNLPFSWFCSRIVPEYSFLDARGLGSFEGRDLGTISEV
jgi:hypothetical protein